MRELLGVSAVATQGGTQTATMTLTIAPFSAGSSSLTTAMPTFNFAPGTTAPADIRLATSGGITLVDNTVFAALPANQFDITYAQLRALDYTNPGQPIALTANSAIALQGNSGRFSKVMVTQAATGSLTFTWVTYAFGF